MKKIRKKHIKYIALCLAILQIFASVPVYALVNSDEDTNILVESILEEDTAQETSDKFNTAEIVGSEEETLEPFEEKSETKEYKDLTETSSETENSEIDAKEVETSDFESEAALESETKEVNDLVGLPSLKNWSVSKAGGTNIWSTDRTTVLNAFKSYIGVPYVWGGASPSGWDCSGYVTYVARSLGVEMGRTTTDMLAYCNANANLVANISTSAGYSSAVEDGTILPGDILIFLDAYGTDVHTAVAIEGTNIIHAWYSGWGTNICTFGEVWAANGITRGEAIYKNVLVFRGLDEPKNGSIEIIKSSSNPELTNGNSCYGLEGAQYNVYNLAGTALYGTITTDADGHGILVDIPADDYHIREEVAPKGYALDSTYHKVTVITDQTTTLEVKDIPLNDPIYILLNKIDSAKNIGLANAEFVIKYYDVYSETNPAIAGYTPTKTWILKTNSTGIARLEDSFLVSGDAFYYSQTGNISLPLGTVTIQETKAPAGYILNSEMYVHVIKEDAITGSVVTYNAPIIENDPYYIFINIKKEDSQTSEFLTGATFKVQEWSGSSYVDSSYKIAYDTVSKLYKSDKLYYTQTNAGKFRVIETGAPTGYTGAWSQEFNITSTNTGTILTPSASNKPYQANVSVRKEDMDNSKGLYGATFNIQEWNGTSYVDTTHTFSWNSATRSYDSSTFYYTQKNAGKYRVVEVSNPYGYVGTWSQEFTITQSNQSFSYTAPNKQVWAKVKLRKIDREFSLFTAQGDATLEGAVYHIYFNETVTHPNGTTYAKGDLAGTATTNENGELEFTDLLPYKYYIVERIPSSGYLLDATIYYVDCSHDGTSTSISKEITVTEQVKKQAFELIKISSDGSSGEAELLEKAGFKIYLISDLVGVANGTVQPSNGSNYTADDFIDYDFKNEKTALDYSSGIAVNAAEIFTDSKGYAKSPELAYGQYVVAESTVPDGYVKINPFTVNIIEDSRTPQIWRIFNDAEFEVYFKIVKKDATTGMTVLKEGAKYRILNIDTGKYVEQWTTYPTKELWGTETNPYMTNEEGYLVTPQTVGFGNYEIIEVEAPSGYTVNGKEGILLHKYQGGDTTYNIVAQPTIKISIKSNTAYLIDSDVKINYIELIQENEQQLGKLNLYKYGDKLSKVKTNTTSLADVSTEFSYISASIEGAQFKVYADSDIYTQDNQGTLLYKKDDLITTITTDSKGQAYVNNLYIGKYRIEEITAGSGFVLNSESKYFEITAMNGEVAFCFVDKEFENIRQKNKIMIQKLDIETELPIAGAVFGLYAFENIKDYEGNILIHKDTLIDTAVSGNDGYANFSKELPLAEYYVKEIQAPKGYISTDTTVYLDGSYTTQSISVNMLSGIFKNKITEVQIIKEDNTTNAILSGAEFALYECDELGNLLAQDALYSWISDADFDYIIKGLEVGKIYAIVEDTAPLNYVQSKPMKFTVMETGDIQYQEYKNDYVKGTFLITKEGEFIESYENNWIENILEGFQSIFHYSVGKVESVTFNLYAAEDIVHPDKESERFFKANELIATITTNNKGIASLTEVIEGLPENFEIGELPLGKYYIIESEAADGFVINSTPRYFELVYADQHTPIVTAKETITNLRQRVEIKVVKKDAELQEALPGAIFELYPTEDIYGNNIDDSGVTTQGGIIIKAGTIMERVITDQNGVVFINSDLPLGMYEMKEVKAPDGYICSNEIIEIDAAYKEEGIEVIELSYEFQNEQTQLEVSKVELSSSESNKSTSGLKQLDGATLAIIDKKKNEVVSEWITGKNKKLVTKLITENEYILKELVTPAGNVTANDILFKLDVYGNLLILIDDEWVKQTENLVEMLDDITKIEISKKNITNDNELQGAHLQIIDKSGTVIEEWISGKEPHLFEKLPIGIYTLIETLAPDGFKIAEKMEFEVLDTGEVQHITMFDLPIEETPKTNDTIFAKTIFYYLLGIQALGIIVVYLVKKKKRIGV